MTKPDASQFSKDERPGEYAVDFTVRGSVRMTIKADSIDDARAKAEAMAEDDDFGLELDDADEVRVDYVRKTLPMYHVIRDGRFMSVSHLKEGDEPREPTEWERTS